MKKASELLKEIQKARDYCIKIATSRTEIEGYNYVLSRKAILEAVYSSNEVKPYLGKILENDSEETVYTFLRGIASGAGSWSERSAYVVEDFKPIILFLEGVVYSNKESLNRIELPFSRDGEITKEFIIEQIEKGRDSIEIGDYRGAITTSTSLLEAVFSYLDREINSTTTINPKDDIMAKYKKLQKDLNLDPSQKKLSDCLKQLLTGLVSIVNGLSYFRNTSSNAHLPQYTVAKHHAVVSLNATNTVVQFLFDTYQYQRSKNKKV